MAQKKKAPKKQEIVERKYNWAPGRSAMFGKLDANVVGPEIERLEKKYKHALEPQQLLDEARSVQSPIHAAFDWNDETAAEKYRLVQARNLLRSVNVTIITPDREERVVPVFVSSQKKTDLTKRSYSSTEYAMSDPELRSEVLKLALREFAALRRKYAELNELSQLFAMVDAAVKKAS